MREGDDFPEVVCFQSKLGTHIQQLDFESVPFGCFHCFKTGHKAFQCPKAKNAKKKNPPSSSLKRVKKVWKKKPTKQGQEDLSLETQKIVVEPKQTSQEPLEMASKEGEVAKTGPSSSLPVDLKADLVEDRACKLGEEELTSENDKASSQKCVQEPGKVNVPREEVQDLGHSEVVIERENEVISGFHDPEASLVHTRVGVTKTGILEDLEYDLVSTAHHLRTPENGLKASRSLIFENKEETSRKKPIKNQPKASSVATRSSSKPDVGSPTKAGRKSGKESREEETRRSVANGCQSTLKDFSKNKR